MFKKCFFFLCALQGVLFGNLYAYPSCSPELSHILKTLYRLPEARHLIQKVESEGSIQICWSPFRGPSSALWHGSTRSIVINSNKRRTDGQKLCSILFELHNALTDHEFNHIDSLAQKGGISKDDYVLTVEKMEYQNVLQTAVLIEKGIREKIFPLDAHWDVFPNFNDHYRMQLQTGHAQAIAAIYDELNPRHVCTNHKPIYVKSNDSF